MKGWYRKSNFQNRWNQKNLTHQIKITNIANRFLKITDIANWIIKIGDIANQNFKIVEMANRNFIKHGYRKSEIRNHSFHNQNFKIVAIANCVNFVNRNYGIPGACNFDFLFRSCPSHCDIALCKIYHAGPLTFSNFPSLSCMGRTGEALPCFQHEKIGKLRYDILLAVVI